MKKLLYHAMRLLPLTVVLCGCLSSTFIKIVKYGSSDTDDFRKFPSLKVSSNRSGTSYPISSKMVNPDLKTTRTLLKSGTYSLIIFHNDSIAYENYYNKHTDSSLSLYFSMTKSVMALLVGCAIDDSLIRTENDFVCDYLPELKKNGFSTIRIIDLLQMTAPVNYSENDNPFGKHALFYYSENLEKDVFKLTAKKKKKKKFEYKSCNTQLLATILRRRLLNMTLTEYLERKIWHPLEMETEAKWIIDRPGGIEKSWCCLAGTAKDFAKIVKLYIDKGRFKGSQIVSENWVDKTFAPLSQKNKEVVYSYGWWLYPKENFFAAIGKDGQFALGWPEKKIIAVRLGSGLGQMNKDKWLKLLAKINLY